MGIAPKRRIPVQWVLFVAPLILLVSQFARGGSTRTDFLDPVVVAPAGVVTLLLIGLFVWLDRASWVAVVDARGFRTYTALGRLRISISSYRWEKVAHVWLEDDAIDFVVRSGTALAEVAAGSHLTPEQRTLIFAGITSIAAQAGHPQLAVSHLSGAST